MHSNSNTFGAPTLAITHEVTPAERQQAHLYLEQTRNALTGAIKGLSEAQWRFTPAPGCWSIAKIAEHVIFVLERVGGPMQDILAQAPAPPAGRNYQDVDAIVIHQFPSRLMKFPAPEFAHPTGRLGSPSEAVELLANCYLTLAELLDKKPDLREHAVEAPPLKAITNGAYDLMDGYQWILAAAGHTERHTKQVLEVKCAENFPEN